MGDSKRKAIQQARREPALREAIERVGAAIQKLARAASASFGADCYLHTQIGAALLAEMGFAMTPVVGFAAWRVGEGDGDVVGHTPNTTGYLPPGAQGFCYHAWLEGEGVIADITTYQLAQKAMELDQADGGHTQVDWCPAVLILPKKSVATYREVAMAPKAGVAYYEARPELFPVLQGQYTLDPEEVAIARMLLQNPDLLVMGPNSIAH